MANNTGQIPEEAGEQTWRVVSSFGPARGGKILFINEATNEPAEISF